MASTIQILCKVLSGEVLKFEFAPTASVDNIKTEILAKTNQKIRKNKYFLLVEEEVVLTVEFKKFIDSDPLIKKLAASNQDICVTFISLDEAKEFERRKKAGLATNRPSKETYYNTDGAATPSSSVTQDTAASIVTPRSSTTESNAASVATPRAQQPEVEVKAEETPKHDNGIAEGELVKELQNQNKAHESTIANLKTEIESKNQTIEKLTKQLGEKDSVIGQLQEQLAAAQSSSASSTAASSELTVSSTLSPELEDQLKKLDEEERLDREQLATRRADHQRILHQLMLEEEALMKQEEERRRQAKLALEQILQQDDAVSPRAPSSVPQLALTSVDTPASLASDEPQQQQPLTPGHNVSPRRPSSQKGFRVPDPALRRRSVKLGDITISDRDEIRLAIEDVLRIANESGWVLVHYTSKNTLTLQGSSDGDLNELLSHLQDDQVQYAIVRVTVGDNNLGTPRKSNSAGSAANSDVSKRKDVFVTWVGEKVGTIERGLKQSHLGHIQKILQPFNLQVFVNGRTNFTLEKLQFIAENNSNNAQLD